ncbi:Tim10/DDP family zinc finger-domain-containing protein [Xylaria sp. FL1777]|nr:Tim10/DDP family zinc finger-domain-containing protein [Xylaria sp. FL1777]
MDDRGFTVDSPDLDKLNNKDRAELQQFLSNETSKARVQATIHSLTEVCFRKCITGTIRSNQLEKAEQSCMANCAERYFEASLLTIKHVQKVRLSGD